MNRYFRYLFSFNIMLALCSALPQVAVGQSLAYPDKEDGEDLYTEDVHRI